MVNEHAALSPPWRIEPKGSSPNVRQGEDVVVAFYGDASVATWPAHTAIRRARREGYEARLRPGVSSLACLLNDLNVHVGTPHGIQAICAHDYVQNPLRFDPSSHLVLWQINLVGVVTDKESHDARELAQALAMMYGMHHEVTLYMAPYSSMTTPEIKCMPLFLMAECEVTTGHSLYVPPLRLPARLPDKLRNELGLS